MRNFYRSARLLVKIRELGTVGSYKQIIEITGLRVSFSIVKSLAWATNTGIIKIWNLSQGKRNAIHDFGDEVALYAGYDEAGGEQLLYIGQTTAVSHDYAQPEIITTLECGDGDKQYNDVKGSISYAAGTPARQILQAIAILLGFPDVVIPIGPDLVYSNGFKFSGAMKEALFKVCTYLSFEASIQNGNLQIIPLSESTNGALTFINESTGMQGIPQRYIYRKIDIILARNAPTDGYKVNVALLPRLVPGNPVALSSTHLQITNVKHRIETVRHVGDTYGPEWASNLEMTRIP